MTSKRPPEPAVHLEGFGAFGGDKPPEVGPGGALDVPRADALRAKAPESAKLPQNRPENPGGPPGMTRRPFEGFESILGAVPGVQLSSDAMQREILAIKVLAFPKLGAGTLFLSVGGMNDGGLNGSGKELCMFTNSRQRYEWARENKIPAFVGGEYTLIAYAAQNDRLWPADFRRFVQRKKTQPGWRLTHGGAVGKVKRLDELRWTLGELLRRIHASLVAVEMNIGG